MNDIDSDDAFGRALGARLRQSSDQLPAQISAADTIRLGRRLRRTRRIIATAVAVVVTLGAGGAAYGVVATIDRTGRGPIPVTPASGAPTVAAPETTASSRPSDAPTPSAPTDSPNTASDSATQSGSGRSSVVSVRLNDLERRGDPTVGTVRDGVWYRVGGRPVELELPQVRNPPEQGSYTGTVVPYGDDGLFASLADPAGPDPRTGELARAMASYRRDGSRTEHEISGDNLVVGPGGSVLWLESSSPDLMVIGRLDPDGQRSTYRIGLESADPDQLRFVAAAESLFVEDDGQVTRYDITGPGEVSAGRPVDPGRRLELVSGDPVTDTVVVSVTETGETGRGRQTCSTVLHADGGPRREWDTCDFLGRDYGIQAVSPDGRYVFATTDGIAGRIRGVVFRTDGTVLFELTGLANHQGVFDSRNRLNLIGSDGKTSGESRSAVVVCTLDEACRQASDTSVGQPNSGHEKLLLVGWQSAPR